MTALSDYRERIRVFLAAVQAGASDASAAAEAGISRATIHRWRHGERPFDEAMRKQLSRARAIRERRWLGWVEDAARPRPVGRQGRTVPGDWKAAQFLLSVSDPEVYASRSRTEITGHGGAPVQVEESIEHRLAVPDVDRLKTVMGLLLSAGAVPQLETQGTNGHDSNGQTHDGE